MHGKHGIVYRTFHQVGFGGNQFTANNHGKYATNQEKQKGGDNILNANDFVVGTKAKVGFPSGGRMVMLFCANVGVF